METMESLLQEPDMPLEIMVTDAGSEILKLRSLAKEAIPMLLHPDRYSLSQRERIVRGFQAVLEGDVFDNGSGTDEEEFEESIFYEPGERPEWPEYEPGERPEWPEKEYR